MATSIDDNDADGNLDKYNIKIISMAYINIILYYFQGKRQYWSKAGNIYKTDTYR